MQARRLRWVMLLAAFCMVTASAQEVAPGTRWHQAHATLLDVNFGDSGFHARWQYFQCACGDLLIRVEQTAPDGVLSGELLLLERRVVLARGAVTQSDDLAPLLQAPALMVQLAFGLLQRALPEGPAGVTGELPITLVERNADLQLETDTSTGTFNAPWQLSGKAWASGPARRRFELDFAFSNPLPDAPPGLSHIAFSGGQDYGRDDYPLPDSTPLAGWKLQWLEREAIQVEDPQEGMTLGDLRAQVRAGKEQER